MASAGSVRVEISETAMLALKTDTGVVSTSKQLKLRTSIGTLSSILFRRSGSMMVCVENVLSNFTAKNSHDSDVLEAY